MPPMTYAALAPQLVCAVADLGCCAAAARESISTLLRRLSPTARPGWAVADILAVALAASVSSASPRGRSQVPSPSPPHPRGRRRRPGGILARRHGGRRGGPGARASWAGRAFSRPWRCSAVPPCARWSPSWWRRPSPSSPPTPCSLPTATARRGRGGGGSAVLVTDSRQPAQFADVVARLDLTGQAATPVAVVRPAGPQRPRPWRSCPTASPQRLPAARRGAPEAVRAGGTGTEPSC